MSRVWPFMSSLPREAAPDPLDESRESLQDDMADEQESDSPYCECGEEPMMEESDWNQCAACGKPLS